MSWIQGVSEELDKYNEENTETDDNKHLLEEYMKTIDKHEPQETDVQRKTTLRGLIQSRIRDRPERWTRFQILRTIFFTALGAVFVVMYIVMMKLVITALYH